MNLLPWYLIMIHIYAIFLCKFKFYRLRVLYSKNINLFRKLFSYTHGKDKGYFLYFIQFQAHCYGQCKFSRTFMVKIMCFYLKKSLWPSNRLKVMGKVTIGRPYGTLLMKKFFCILLSLRENSNINKNDSSCTFFTQVFIYPTIIILI